jgi:hypothetical protein
VAEWFQETLGLEVIELDILPSAAVKLGRGMVPFWAENSSAELRTLTDQLSLALDRSPDKPL